MPTHDLIDNAKLVMTEGAVIERLHRMADLRLDPHLANAGLLYDSRGRERLAGLYRNYLDTARSAGWPLILDTPTWRVNWERHQASPWRDREVIREAVEFMLEVRAAAGPYREQVLVGGLMGCRGDAYRADEALREGEAESFHAWQAARLAEAGVDFLHGATLPALSEALGLARAMAATGCPYVLSFVVRPSGHLLDGTLLATAMEALDRLVSPPPWFFMLNCVHPVVAAAALDRQPRDLSGRLLGLQGNTSARSPEELDGSHDTEGDEPEVFAQALWGLHTGYGLKILGGCCGTDERHLRALAGLANPV